MEAQYDQNLNWIEAICLESHGSSLFHCAGQRPGGTDQLEAPKKASIILPQVMTGSFAYRSLAPKTKNMVVAGGLTAFVFGVYFYTMRAVGGTDELQSAIDKFEEQRNK